MQAEPLESLQLPLSVVHLPVLEVYIFGREYALCKRHALSTGGNDSGATVNAKICCAFLSSFVFFFSYCCYCLFFFCLSHSLLPSPRVDILVWVWVDITKRREDQRKSETTTPWVRQVLFSRETQDAFQCAHVQQQLTECGAAMCWAVFVYGAL